MQGLRRAISALMLLGGVACSGGSEQLTPLPYQDDFSNPSSGWETADDLSAEVRYDAGSLRIIVKQASTAQWTLSGKRFKDGGVEVEARRLGGPTDNGFGIIFRVQDRKNFYFFNISSDGYWRAGAVTNGEWQEWMPWQAHPVICTEDAPNVLRVTMEGKRFAFYVNDQLVGTREDETFAVGDVGLMAVALFDAPGVDVAFDNFRVLPLR